MSAKKRSTARKATRKAARKSSPRKTTTRAKKTTRTKVASAPRSDANGIVAQIDEIIAQGGDGTLDIDGVELEVSRLDKVFFPETGHTKGDIMRWYAWISPMLLPAIEGRPLVLRRFPNGVGSPAFYQQRAPQKVPNGVRVETIDDPSLEQPRRLVGGDLATLLYTIQLGAISVDPWHGRLPDTSTADYAIVDLDPGDDASFDVVIDVARWVHDEMESVGLHALAKTSGSTGIHIVMPFAPGTSADTAKLAAELIATRTAERHPKVATVHRWVGTRPKGSVYVDYLQNIRGKTVASVYSVRARPQPTVSTPLDWSEVRPGLDPRYFTIDTVPARIEDVGDLWGAAMRKPNDLDRLLSAR